MLFNSAPSGRGFLFVASPTSMSPSTTQQHFDKVATGYYHRNYDVPRTRHQRALALRRELCLDMLRGISGRILDVGCGPGALAVPLGEAGHSIVAFDLSPRMVIEARRLIGPARHAGFCVGDATALPFASAHFDVVVTTGMLEYVPNVTGAVSDIARVLRPRGTLIATVSLPRRLERAMTRYFGPLIMRLKYGALGDEAPYHRAFASAELDQLLADAHLAVEVRRFSYFAPFPLDVVYPSIITALDKRLGRWLERSHLVARQAKTYIVKATRI